MPLKLTSTFAANANVPPYDVRQVKTILNHLGYYAPFAKVGMTDISDQAVFDGLKKFQAAHGLKPTGTMRPGDATEAALSRTTEHLTGKYIWHTVEDDHVRSSHAARDGQIFDYAHPPEGGNPGEDYNCRCWAVNMTSSKIIDKPAKLSAKEMTRLEKVDPPIIPVYPLEYGAAAATAITNGGLTAIRNLLNAKKILTRLKEFNDGKSQAEIQPQQAAEEIPSNHVQENPEWRFGSHKTQLKWENRMKKGGWTEKEITETIKYGQREPAPNEVNPANKASSFERNGKFVVRDDKTNELLQISGPNFIKKRISN